MEDLFVLRKRNKLMAQIMWFVSILQISFATISGLDKKTIFIMGPALIAVSIVMTLLVWKKLIETKIMYVAALGLAIVHFLFVHLFHDLNGFLIGFITMLIIALYQEYKSTILMSLFVILNIVYGYFTGGEKMFASFYNNTGLIIVMLVLLVCTFLIALQAKTSEKMRKDIETQKMHLEISKEGAERSLHTLKTAIDHLIDFNKDLQIHINATSDISKDLSFNFKEINTNVDSQTNLITDIDEEINLETSHIKNVTGISGSLHALSQDTLQKAGQCDHSIMSLSNEMEKMNSSVENTVSLMKTLNLQTEDIENILVAVNNISKQINLLALNAAIEAARAGEHGRGFSVVADEIRKLAVESEQSNAQIADILVDIRNQTQKSFEEINAVENSTNNSNEATKNIIVAFKEINHNSKEMVAQSTEIDHMTSDIETISSDVLSKITSIATSARENSTSVEEALYGITQQDNRLASIVDSFNNLEALIVDLENLYG